MSLAPLRFSAGDEEFWSTLRARVDAYFSRTNETRHATRGMLAKTALILGTFFVSYGLVVSGALRAPWVYVAIIVFHVAMFQTTIGIAHDATHYAYTRDRAKNRILWRFFDVLGIESRFWIDTHIHSHHAAPNVPLRDSAIESFSLVRLHPRTERRSFHAYQHVYILPIYALVSIFQMYVLDFIALEKNLYAFRKGQGAERKRIAWLYACKAFVLGYSLLVPLYVVPGPRAWTALACLVGHACCGLTIGLVFQTTHLAADTRFPEPDATGRLPSSYARHILQTTADVAPDNALYTFYAGGLNLHVAHHLFPGVSQMHLPALTRIVRATSKELGMPYRAYGLGAAVVSHLSLLKRLGRQPSASVRTVAPEATSVGLDM